MPCAVVHLTAAAAAVAAVVVVVVRMNALLFAAGQYGAQSGGC